MCLADGPGSLARPLLFLGQSLPSSKAMLARLFLAAPAVAMRPGAADARNEGCATGNGRACSRSRRQRWTPTRPPRCWANRVMLVDELGDRASRRPHAG